ncbi:MAG: hypothetical protein PW735_05485 [Acidobacteriaceae bacterium]|nr:hypothetical protein [Acidobacteriaceae bacterium]
MRTRLLSLLLLCAPALLSATLHAQTVKITVQLRDGNTGQPLPHQRLLLLLSQDASAPPEQVSLTTQEDGDRQIELHVSATAGLQVSPVGMDACAPLLSSYRLSEILQTGITAPNTCNPTPLWTVTRPGSLTLYLRKPSSTEKKLW